MKPLIVTIIIVFAGSCMAQGIPGNSNPMGRRGGSAPGVEASYSLPNDVLDSNDRFGWSRFGANVGAPISLDPDFRVFANARAWYLRLFNDRETLPTRLVGSRVTATGIASFSGLTLTNIASVAYRSDGDRLRWDSFDISLISSLKIPLSDEWALNTGLYFTTGVSFHEINLRYVPIPAVSVEWKPNDELTFDFGIPRTSMEWKPSKYFQWNAAYSAPIFVSTDFTHEITEWFTLREFFGYFNERYHLTGERWPNEDHMAYLSTWGTGVTAMFTIPFGDGERPPTLIIRATYGFGFGGKVRILDYKEDQELHELKSKPSHSFLLGIAIRF